MWGNAKEGSADELENHLCHAPVWVLPDPFQLSFKQPEEIETEASGLWEQRCCRESNLYVTIVTWLWGGFPGQSSILPRMIRNYIPLYSPIQ